MMWWIALAYAVIAILIFIALVRSLEPLDGRAWLTLFLLSVFWPFALVWFVIP